MSNYRFRVDDGKLVLQVERPAKYSPYGNDREVQWVDATVEDIPVADPFRSQPAPVKLSDGMGYAFNTTDGTWTRT